MEKSVKECNTLLSCVSPKLFIQVKDNQLKNYILILEISNGLMGYLTLQCLDLKMQIIHILKVCPMKDIL